MSCNDKMIALKFDVSTSKFLIYDIDSVVELRSLDQQVIMLLTIVALWCYWIDACRKTHIKVIKFNDVVLRNNTVSCDRTVSMIYVLIAFIHVYMDY